MKTKSYIDQNGDATELDEGFFSRASRGRPPRPAAQHKVSISIRLDRDIVEGYRASGKGWQSRLNADLRKIREGA